MSKNAGHIVSLKALVCGCETFRFSDLFINAAVTAEETLPINVLLLEHRRYGHALVNTGCTGQLKKNKVQYLKYKQRHALHFDERDSILVQLQREGMDPLLIKRVLLTHCSPECCGALPLLPKYEIVSSAQVLCLLKAGVADGDVMRSTLPDPKVPIKAAGLFQGNTVLKDYFKWVFDIFGDGSVLSFDISGHRSEMMGLYFTESRLLYAADAAIDERVLEQDLVPNEKLLSMQAYPNEYLLSLMTLRRLYREHPDITIRFLHSKEIPAFTL